MKEDPRVRPHPESKGQVWDCHLLTAGTSDGTSFEIMPFVDARSKECLATLVGRSISTQDVTDCLFNLFVLRGAPECIRSNNGAGSIAKAIDDWLRQSGVETHSVKGRLRNSGAGSYSRKLKDELIDKRTFTTLSEAKAAIEGWRELYNGELSRMSATADEPTQSSGPDHSADGVGAVSIPTPRHSPAEQTGSDQSITQPDSPGGQLGSAPAPSLPKSPGRGAKSHRFVPSRYSLAVGAAPAPHFADHDSLVAQVELHQAQGLPDSVHGWSKVPRTMPSPDLPAIEVGADQSIPQDDLLVGKDESFESPGWPCSMNGGAEDGQSVRSQDLLDVIVARQSVQPQGSVAELARTHGPGHPSQLVTAKVGSDAQSLKPSLFSRFRVRTAFGEVKKTLARSTGWVLVAIPILLVALVSLVLVAPYFGWRVDTVRSGSTEPGLKAGSLVVTRPVQAEDISVGDVITFRSPMSGEITSLRVSAIEKGPSFRTEGITNGEAEGFVTPAQDVIGRVWFHVPFAGYVIQYLMTPICVLMLFVFGLGIVVSGIASILQLRRRPPD